MRHLCLSALAAIAAGLVLAAPAAAQQTETPSSRPLPGPCAPPPPLTVPSQGAGAASASTGADRQAASVAVRTQCGADRARVCRDAPGDGATCLAAKASQVSPDCQSALEALKEAHAARSGG